MDLSYCTECGEGFPLGRAKLEVFRADDNPDITFKGSDGVYYSIIPEDMAEVKLLLSEAHIVHHNFGGE